MFYKINLLKFNIVSIYLLISSCGFKAPPSPIFPTVRTQFDKEIEKRKNAQLNELDKNKEENKDKKSNSP